MADRAPPGRRPPALIRPFRRQDREAVRDIFRAGGQRGAPLRTYIEDEEIPLALFADYHMDYEPECCLVVESEGMIVGYALCSADTRRYNRVIATRVLPRLLARVLWRLLTLQYRGTSTFRVIFWFLTRSWREIPEPPLDRFPAHIHLTLSPKYRGFRLGRMLVDAAFDLLRSRGAIGGHGVVIEEAGHNAFAPVLGGTLRESRRCTLWRHCSDKEWEFKLLTRELVKDSSV